MSDDEGNARPEKQQHRTTCHESAQLPKMAIGLGAVSSLGMVGAAPVSDHKHWIDVNDGSVLGNTKKDIRFLDRKIYGCPFYLFLSSLFLSSHLTTDQSTKKCK